MTTSIDITSDQFAKDTTFRTADGKTIRVKHFCVEESTKISLKDLKVGQKVRTKGDEIITFVKVFDDGREWPYLFRQANDDTLSFREDGSYYSERTPSENDIVKILPYNRPHVDLTGIVPGQKVRTFDGEVLTYEKKGHGPTWPHYFRAESGQSRTFTASGVYSPDLIPTDRDIAEILPYEAPLVSLGDLPIGSTFRTRGGLICTLEKSNIPECGLFFGRPPNTDPAGLFYDADGSCRRGNVYDAVEVVTRAKLKLSIENAVKGDTFVLRDGRKYICTGEKRLSLIRTKMKDGCAGLNFNPDGSAYGLGSYADVVEIIPAPKVSIAGAKKGDTFVLRNGRRYVFTGEVVSSKPTRNREAICEEACDDRILWFYEDGKCPNRDQFHDVIEFVQAPKAPRISIEGARKGDKLVTRDGRTFTCTGGLTCSKGLKTIDKDGNAGLTFSPDGSCPGIPYADIVELIPAPRPSLVDRVAEQVSLQPDKIKEIVLSYSDYKEFPKEYPLGDCKSYFKGVRLLQSSSIPRGCIRIELKAD